MQFERDFDGLREIRARSPKSVQDALTSRSRRQLLEADGRLFILAADHPGRGALGVGSSAMAMGSRRELLRRLVLGLERRGVDGVLATPDIIDDLASLGVLDGKLVIGSVNRGGLSRAAFELDDRTTGYDVSSALSAKLDAIKCLLRIALDDHATASTLEQVARVVTDASRNNLPVFLEPFMTSRRNGQVVNDLSTDAVVRSIAIAQALGASSAWSWLKLPVVPEMERVVDSTTLPIVLLGGDSQSDPSSFYDDWARALTLPGVRGMIVGRSVLYPHDGDVGAAVDRVADLVRPS